MIKSPVWNKSSGWTLVLGLVLNLLADPAGVGEHQRRERVRKSNSRNLNRNRICRSLESVACLSIVETNISTKGLR